MQPGLVVVALDEGEDLGLSVGGVAPGGGRGPFEFERGEEALGHGVVPAVALAAHALKRAGLGEQIPEAFSCELRATVRVEYQPRRWVAPCQSAAQRLTRKVGIKTVAE